REGVSPAEPVASERPASTRLVVMLAQPGPADTDLPLGVSVAGDGAGTAVEINGLAPGTVLSAGRALGAQAWRLPFAELAGVRVRPPSGFGGVMSLIIELRRADDSVIERRSLRLEWIAAKEGLPAQGEGLRLRRNASADEVGTAPLVSREG